MALACAAEQGGEPIGQLDQAYCSDVNLTPNDFDGVASVGAVIEWTASPACDVGDTPVYEFYQQPPGGSWQLVRAYDTDASFTWDSSGEVEGQHRFQVWVKDIESDSAYTAYSGRTFVLGSFDSCGPATVTADPPSPSPAGERVVLHMTADCGANRPEFLLERQVESGAWDTLGTWTTSDSAYLGGLTNEPGVKTFRISTRPYLGPRTGADATVAYQHEIIGGCTGITVDSTPSQSLITPGTPVVFEADATCGGTAEYQFWLQAPGSGWVEAQPYGTSSSWTFDTQGLAGGQYRVQVWARNQGRSAAYEVWTARQLQVAVACDGSALSSDTPSPSAAGGIVTLNARAASCEFPEFLFFLKPPDGPWQTLQPYGPASSATWDTNGATPGTYLFQVWTRLAGTSAGYQSWAAYQHVIQ
jgi:hypothetical protein